LFSNKTLWLIVHLLSAVLSNWLPPACKFTFRYRTALARWARGGL
jgi:hypothetical protein